MAIKTIKQLLLLLLLLLLHPFNDLFSRQTWVSPYQKSKTSLDLNEARDEVMGRQWHPLDHMQNLHLFPDRQPDQHLISQFLQFGCSS